MLIHDSTNPYDIPTTVEAVAGYVDGLYAWDANGWARFPTAAKIGISVNPFNQIGDALDVETGDATPAQAPVWVKARLSQGAQQPWVYVNRANRQATEDAMWAAGIPIGQVGMWIATLDGTQSVPQYRYPVAAVQYANSNLAGGHYDLSVTTTYAAASGTLEAIEVLDPNDPIVKDILVGIQNAYNMAVYANVAAKFIEGEPVPDGKGGTAPNLLVDLLAAVKAIPANSSPDLTAVTASLTALNAKVDLIAAKLAKDLA